mmetsp:Transcript_16382/g.33214  ORF Transcript_16382/g.33214 Transcript_16382/m.33214 type:complete len:100 (+) Transcript_16382:835-1134(+)
MRLGCIIQNLFWSNVTVMKVVVFMTMVQRPYRRFLGEFRLFLCRLLVGGRNSLQIWNDEATFIPRSFAKTCCMYCDRQEMNYVWRISFYRDSETSMNEY